MKHLLCTIIALATLTMTHTATAQISIDKVEAKPEKISFRDTMKQSSASTDYFSLARHKAERAAIRKERNTLEITTSLQASLTSYNDPWVDVSGGDNSIATVAHVFLKHTFTKNLFTLETKFEGKFGYNRMKVETPYTYVDSEGVEQQGVEREGIWFKNQDEFYISIDPSWKMSKNWSYGASVKFRSQIAKGYLSRTEQEREDLKSAFMTPGYLDLSVGLKYKCPHPKLPFVIDLSPIALSAVYASNEWIRREQFDEEGNRIKKAFAYGIEDPDKSSKYEGGSSIQVGFDRTFGKTGYLRYRTTLFSFWGWITNMGLDNKIKNYDAYRDAYREWEAAGSNIKEKPRLPIHPTVRWENTVDIKATRFLTTTLSFQLYYNRAQNTHIQTKTLLSVGLSYTFKNK
ncbi:MAG: DUF3078 domain-containing protein [Alistipes sp.]|nr:DUF3078 domain-containing protein [Rikenellaceae bacterium]MBQ2728286.1 DUF3078 domain-containing protein [Alistipes sp.]MBQ7298107.1 DUF3078 domain-containing protein [Alistipes sp.]MBQ8471185.1 DUF3078 domain-containing protein [Alistipes sp.]MBQ8916463.1 DUF3078 domain-containing protein [Alistipes sp.]